MRAQAGMEYLIVFALSLLVVGILWNYSGSSIGDTKWDVQVSYAKASLNKIAEISDVVYVQGPPAQFNINPVFPENVAHTYIINNSVTIELVWKGGILRNITAYTLSNLTGSLSTAAGQHTIHIAAAGDSVTVNDG